MAEGASPKRSVKWRARSTVADVGAVTHTAYRCCTPMWQHQHVYALARRARRRPRIAFRRLQTDQCGGAVRRMAPRLRDLRRPPRRLRRRGAGDQAGVAGSLRRGDRSVASRDRRAARGAASGRSAGGLRPARGTDQAVGHGACGACRPRCGDVAIRDDQRRRLLRPRCVCARSEMERPVFRPAGERRSRDRRLHRGSRRHRRDAARRDAVRSRRRDARGVRDGCAW